MLATWPTGTYRRAMNTDEFDTFGYLLGDAARVLRSRFDAYARTVGVTRQQWLGLLALMRQEPVNQTRLAAYLEVEPISLSRSTDRLDRKGGVEGQRGSVGVDLGGTRA